MLIVSSFERITSPICLTVTSSKLRRRRLAAVGSAERSRSVALEAAVSMSTPRDCADRSLPCASGATASPPAEPYCSVAARGRRTAFSASEASLGDSARRSASRASAARFADSRSISACRSNSCSAAFRASRASRLISPSRWSAVWSRSISAEANTW